MQFDLNSEIRYAIEKLNMDWERAIRFANAKAAALKANRYQSTTRWK